MVIKITFENAEVANFVDQSIDSFHRTF
jgi:hypothetical protein